MASTSNVQITISLQDPSLDDDELQAEVENLLPQMKEVDGVENVDLVPVTEAPKGSKALGGFLLGMLQAEVSVANIKALFGFLGDRIGAKPQQHQQTNASQATQHRKQGAPGFGKGEIDPQEIVIDLAKRLPLVIFLSIDFDRRNTAHILLNQIAHFRKSLLHFQLLRSQRVGK